MTRLEELNIARAKAAEVVRSLGILNSPIGYEARMTADANYRLAEDALDRAEREYRAELRRTPTSVLSALALAPSPPLR